MKQKDINVKKFKNLSNLKIFLSKMKRKSIMFEKHNIKAGVR